MERYIGAKIIHAEPAWRTRPLEDSTEIVLVSKTEYAGTIKNLPAGTEDGYKVVYEDGYTSWSPKEVFEEAYRKTEGLTFGLALEALKKGMCVSRKGWNGKGMHVTMERCYTFGYVQIDNKCLLLFNVHGRYNTWVPSITDVLAEDWMIVD